MKNVLLVILILFSVVRLEAQEKGKLRFGGNLGYSIPASGLGMSMDILDVRYNIFDNLNAGIKFGGAFMVRDIHELNSTTGAATMHFNSNAMLVSDYYFNNGSSAFAPFVGAGIGSFTILDTYMEYQLNQSVNYTYTELPDAPKVIGGSIRGGFELGRLRLAMEYYFLPETIMYDADNIMHSVGTTPNSYLTINLGIILGGGRWLKKVPAF